MDGVDPMQLAHAMHQRFETGRREMLFGIQCCRQLQAAFNKDGSERYALRAQVETYKKHQAALCTEVAELRNELEKSRLATQQAEDKRYEDTKKLQKDHDDLQACQTQLQKALQDVQKLQHDLEQVRGELQQKSELIGHMKKVMLS